jgi:hypothetical protein
VFDNWWHNAYGLDVNIINPPHLFVFFGSYATKIGTMAWIASILNRSTEASRRFAAWLFSFVAALGVWQSSYMIMIDTWTYKLHSAACYLAVAMFLPAWLIGGARGRPTNWDALYLWLLYCHRAGTGMAATLIRAQAKLGPVYHQITHLIPVRFCPDTVAQLSDGSRIVWERDVSPLRANVPASFKFRVEEKDGSPVHNMEPYMGMAAHAEVVATDLSVFAHIHPAGSVSMAALDMVQSELMRQSSASCIWNGDGDGAFLTRATTELQLSLWISSSGRLSHLRADQALRTSADRGVRCSCAITVCFRREYEQSNRKAV